MTHRIKQVWIFCLTGLLLLLLLGSCGQIERNIAHSGSSDGTVITEFPSETIVNGTQYTMDTSKTAEEAFAEFKTAAVMTAGENPDPVTLPFDWTNPDAMTYTINNVRCYRNLYEANVELNNFFAQDAGLWFHDANGEYVEYPWPDVYDGETGELAAGAYLVLFDVTLDNVDYTDTYLKDRYGAEDDTVFSVGFFDVWNYENRKAYTMCYSSLLTERLEETKSQEENLARSIHVPQGESVSATLGFLLEPTETISTSLFIGPNLGSNSNPGGVWVKFDLSNVMEGGTP